MNPKTTPSGSGERLLAVQDAVEFYNPQPEILTPA